MVFVVNNRVSAAAVDAAAAVARPGRDAIHVVTCVSNELQKSDAEEVCKGFQKRLLKSMVDTHVEVLVSGPGASWGGSRGGELVANGDLGEAAAGWGGAWDSRVDEG